MWCIKFIDLNYVSILYCAILKSLLNSYWRLPIWNRIEINLQFYLQINPVSMRMDALPSDSVFILRRSGKENITEEKIIEEHFKGSETQPLTLKESIMGISKCSSCEGSKKHETEERASWGYAFCLILT